MNKDEIKELVVNGERLARYVADVDLFLKVDLVEGLPHIDYEDLCIRLIQHVEGRAFVWCGFLNIE